MNAQRNSFLLGLALGCAVGVLIGRAFAKSSSRQSSPDTVANDLQQAVENDDDPFNNVERDIGDRLHEFGRPAIWNASHMELTDTGYSVAAGPTRYTDENDQSWDFYSIDVEKSDGSMRHVYFQRDFEIAEIPREIINKKVDELVSFNAESRVVTFSIGSRTEAYQLPYR